MVMAIPVEIKWYILHLLTFEKIFPEIFVCIHIYAYTYTFVHICVCIVLLLIKQGHTICSFMQSVIAAYLMQTFDIMYIKDIKDFFY